MAKQTKKVWVDRKGAKEAAVAGDVPAETQAVSERPRRRDWSTPASEHNNKRNAFFDKVKARANREWSDSSVEDRLRIDPDIIADLHAEGVALQWVTQLVLGKPMPEHSTKFERGGWLRVEPGEIPGVNCTEVDGLALMARPLSIHNKAKEFDKRAARQQVQQKEQAMFGGDLPKVTLDSRHPSATRSNRIGRSYEPIAIPTEE